MANYIKKKKDSTMPIYLGAVFRFITRTLIIVLIIKYLLFTPGMVSGTSMEPGFYLGARFVVNKIPYYFLEPERYDVVQLVDPTNTKRLLIKRIIGLPGETITLVNNKVFVTLLSGETMEPDESFLYEGMVTRQAIASQSITEIPPNHYFVLGDNRLASRDSREIGPVHRKYINGPVVTLSRGSVPATVESSEVVTD